MSSLSWLLQKALYEKLADNTSLMALITGVHDSPQGTENLPYLVVGDDTSSEDGTKTSQHYQHTLTLHVYSDARPEYGGHRGRKQVKEIMAAVEAAVDRKSFALESGTVSEFRWEFSESFTEEGGEVHHGVVRCRAFTNP